MPPRIRVRPRALCMRCTHASTPISTQTASYASIATASATVPAPEAHQSFRATAPIRLYPPTQPPSHKPPEVRKTQLHRQYQSLLRSSPLILIFQHNNVKAVELMSIRRELAVALRKVDAERIKNGQDPLADEIRLQIIQTNIFASALRVVEFFNPEEHITEQPEQQILTHGLSRRAHEIANNRKLKLELEPILSGPLAVVAFPSVAPQYLKAVMSILSPSKGDFPAPTRRANPDYYEPAVQQGLQKLMLLGARVEGKVFDVGGTKWVGGIDGGIDGLRAQLVHMLQGVGGSLTSALEGASKSLYFTVEVRRLDMEEKEKGSEEKKD
ncbi:hypothetical protein EK21DRAFT_97105 [Setomelanomma holmii]|uniref:Uncharacterized protein n=1 Tax=Setomelanomma holmii TaxID=210430 RepID=A0A9P4LRY8_9PLEO|nr:hypothetical protein EK21DRAFT_97105 [Setomelanomma holmii]